MRPLMIAALFFIASIAAPAFSQQIQLTGPLAGDPTRTDEGVAFTLHGMTGAMIANDHTMRLAPGSDAPDVVRHITPRLDGDRGYLGSGLRGFYQGEYVRAGGTVGAFFVDRGLTDLGRAAPEGVTMRTDTSWGAHLEVFAGGQINLKPVFPYLDVVGFLDIVQTRYTVFAVGGDVLGRPSYNAYLFGVGPRLGVILPITENVYLDLAVGGGVVGANRFLFSAGFGYTTGDRPKPGNESDIIAL